MKMIIEEWPYVGSGLEAEAADHERKLANRKRRLEDYQADLEVPFEPDKNMVVVPVSKDRCEICSGSDIAASFHGFVQACVDRDVRRATIVGGSPAYRRKLQGLADDDEQAPKLNLVSGTRKREKRRAASDMRSSDVVVIWGGTELDHSVSEVYRGKDARIVRVAHRGIARMLQIVRSELRR